MAEYKYICGMKAEGWGKITPTNKPACLGYGIKCLCRCDLRELCKRIRPQFREVEKIGK